MDTQLDTSATDSDLAKKLSSIAQTAIDCQNACNAAGVAHSLASTVFPVIWQHARRTGKGTNWVNSHPIVYVMLHKLVDLNDSDVSCFMPVSQRFDLVERIAKAASLEHITAIY
jgi:hypothetical protein